MQTKADDVMIDGRRLETAWLEPADASLPVVVMLHEGLGSVALWKDFPQRLAERTGCGILLYSRYGYGRSDRLAERRPVDYLHREGEVVLPELLRRHGVVKPVVLGHSDGASIALIYAGSSVDGPRGLILEAPHVFVEDRTVRSIEQAKSVFETSDWRAKLGRYHEDPEATFRGWNDIWRDPRFRSWNIESHLESIRCPVLVIQGQDDEYASAAQVESIVEHVPSAQAVLLPHCGHSPHTEQPEETLMRIESFLKALVD
jgi:pimeloyl-ACP methyl ester carboxylesterase